MNSGEIRNWLKDGGAVTLTVVGVLVFVLLRLPYAIFYARLGTSPEEVGLGYVELLSQSTTGMLAVLSFVGVLVFTTAAVVAYVVFSSHTVRAYSAIRNSPCFGKTPEELSEVEFEAHAGAVNSALSMIPGMFETVLQTTPAENMRRWRRRRDLALRKIRSADEESELAELRSPREFGIGRLFGLGVPLTRKWLASHGAMFAAASLLFVLCVGLPILAYQQAGAVRNGRGANVAWTGLFAFRGDPSELVWAGHEVPDGARSLLGSRSLMLLGRNDRHLVLWDVSTGHVVRVPIDDVVVASSIGAISDERVQR